MELFGKGGDQKRMVPRGLDAFVGGVDAFGLRSAPKIFNTPADVLEWILDDFLVIRAPILSSAQETSKRSLTTSTYPLLLRNWKVPQ